MTDASRSLAPTDPIRGLTVAEVEARRAAGLNNTPPPPTTRTYAQIVRENVFTFINNVLFLLGLALVAVGRPFDAVVSLAVISTNIIVSVVQEIRAKRTLDRVALLTRPTATVIRDGAEHELGPEQLVVGRPAHRRRRRPDRARRHVLSRARSRSTSPSSPASPTSSARRPATRSSPAASRSAARARYVAAKVGNDSLANQITVRRAHLQARPDAAPARGLRRDPRRAADRGVPRGDGRPQRASSSRPRSRTWSSEASILAGLVPNGLFVSIAIAYALAAVRILRYGALVQQSNAVETLSHVDVLCLDKTGTLTANRLVVRRGPPARRATDDELAPPAGCGRRQRQRRQQDQRGDRRRPRRHPGQARRGDPVQLRPQVERRRRRRSRRRRRRAHRHHRPGRPDLPPAVLRGRWPGRPTDLGGRSRPRSRSSPARACGCCWWSAPPTHRPRGQGGRLRRSPTA